MQPGQGARRSSARPRRHLPPVADDVGHALTVDVTAQTRRSERRRRRPRRRRYRRAGPAVTRRSDVGAEDQRHGAGRPDAVARSALDGVADRVHLPVATLLGRRDAMRRDRRRGATSYTLTPDDIGATICPSSRPPAAAAPHRRARADHGRCCGALPAPAPARPSRSPAQAGAVTTTDGPRRSRGSRAPPAALDGRAHDLGPWPQSQRLPHRCAAHGRSTSRMPRQRPTSSARRRTTRSGTSPRSS